MKTRTEKKYKHLLINIDINSRPTYIISQLKEDPVCRDIKNTFLSNAGIKKILHIVR